MTAGTNNPATWFISQWPTNKQTERGSTVVDHFTHGTNLHHGWNRHTFDAGLRKKYGVSSNYGYKKCLLKKHRPLVKKWKKGGRPRANVRNLGSSQLRKFWTRFSPSRTSSASWLPGLYSKSLEQTLCHGAGASTEEGTSIAHGESWFRLRATISGLVRKPWLTNLWLGLITAMNWQSWLTSSWLNIAG